jgi:hypothetical protein
MPTGSAAASTSTSWWHGTTIVEMVGVYLRVNLGVGCTRFRIPSKQSLSAAFGGRCVRLRSQGVRAAQCLFCELGEAKKLCRAHTYDRGECISSWNGPNGLNFNEKNR